jgi:predicted DNA-binding protein
MEQQHRGPAPKYGKRMGMVGVRLPEHLERWLTSRAAHDGRRPTDVLRELIERAADADQDLSRA